MSVIREVTNPVLVWRTPCSRQQLSLITAQQFSKGQLKMNCHLHYLASTNMSLISAGPQFMPSPTTGHNFSVLCWIYLPQAHFTGIEDPNLMIRDFQALPLSLLRNSVHFPRGWQVGRLGAEDAPYPAFKYSLGLYSEGGGEQMAQWAIVLALQA